jgi:hypothetical protein
MSYNFLKKSEKVSVFDKNHRILARIARRRMRSIFALIIGLAAIAIGFWDLGRPVQETEKSGMLYQHFGIPGPAYGIIAVGLVILLAGAFLFKRAFFDSAPLVRETLRNIREAREAKRTR